MSLITKFLKKGGVMMKGNKKVLVLAVLVLLLAVTGTFAIYRNSANGTGSVDAAEWSVKIGGTDIASANFTFDYDDIDWTSLTGYNDTIAPGSTGTITIPVDATSSEVDVLLTATLGTITGLPDGMTVTVDGGGSQTISYSETANAMKTNVVLNVAWSGTDGDAASKDTTDLAAEGSSISIPVTLTAKQSVTSHAQP